MQPCFSHDHLSSVATRSAGVVLDKPMSSAWQSIPHPSRNVKRICLRVSNWFALIINLDFLWQSFWIYARLGCRFVKIKSSRFSIFCCWICDRKKYWIPDNFTICISVNLIGSSSKTNADHLSPFCSSNSQYSMFQMFFSDGPTHLSPTDVRSHNFQHIIKTFVFRVTQSLCNPKNEGFYSYTFLGLHNHCVTLKTKVFMICWKRGGIYWEWWMMMTTICLSKPRSRGWKCVQTKCSSFLFRALIPATVYTVKSWR